MKTIRHDMQKIHGRSPIIILTLAALGFCFGSNALAAPVQPTFPSAADAAQRLFQAVQNNDERAIANTLGGPTDLTTSTDPGQDKAERELFVRKYQEMHRLGHEPDGSMTLYIGPENWPFPVPLVSQNGAWHFDAAAGRTEVLYRRIGENELAALVACEEFAASEPHHTAATADSAKGLSAKLGGGSVGADPILLNGYYFRLVPPRKVAEGSRPSIFLIAYPAEYRSSGVMTFLAAKDGVVYEKDLGANTSQLASTITAFREDPTWRPAGE